jgi:hypothetical protein
MASGCLSWFPKGLVIFVLSDSGYYRWTSKNIRCIEHGGKNKIILSLVAKQLEVGEVFGLGFLRGSGLSTKVLYSKPGRKTKHKVSAQS